MREDVGSHSCGMGHLYAVRSCVASSYRALYMYADGLRVVIGCVCTEGLGVVRVYVPGAAG